MTTDDKIENARLLWEVADAEAGRVEQDATRARRRANAAKAHYEQLRREQNGEQPLPFGETS